MYRGITSGYNKAFIIDETIKNNLINRNPDNHKIIKPLIRE